MLKFIWLIASSVIAEVLLIGSSNSTSSFSSFENILKTNIIPYKKFFVDSVETLNLTNMDGSPKYSLIIFPNSYYWWYNPEGNWKPLMTKEQNEELEKYESEFGVRRISCNIYPVSLNVKPVNDDNPGCCVGENEFYFDESNSRKLSSIGIYHYPAKIVNSTYVKPVLFSKMGVIATVTSSNDTETLEFYTSFGAWSSTSNYLAKYALIWGFRDSLPDNRPPSPEDYPSSGFRANVELAIFGIFVLVCFFLEWIYSFYLLMAEIFSH